MPTVQTKPVGQTLLDTYKYGLDPIELAIAKSPSDEYVNHLINYLNDGNDLTAEISISYSFKVTEGIFTTASNTEVVASFASNATFAHNVAYKVASIGVTDLSFLADYDVDLNQNFSFTGSYNGVHPHDGTPLHIAAFYSDDPELAQSFLELDAQPNIINSNGITAAELALEQGHYQFANCLQSYIQEHPELAENVTYEQYQEMHSHKEDNEAVVDLSDVIDTDATIPGLDSTLSDESINHSPSFFEQASDYFWGIFYPTSPITALDEPVTVEG